MIALLAIAQLALAAPRATQGAATAPATARVGTRAQSAKSAAPTPPTHVEADAIEYLYKEHRTIMTGKPLVTFTREDAKLVCRKMVADHDPAGDIHHAVCDGDVPDEQERQREGDRGRAGQHAGRREGGRAGRQEQQRDHRQEHGEARHLGPVGDPLAAPPAGRAPPGGGLIVGRRRGHGRGVR